MRSYGWSLLAASVLTCTLGGCRTQSRTEDPGRAAIASLDLTSIAPIGYEICNGRGVTLSRGNIALTLRMPVKVEIPPESAQNEPQYIEFRPGRHAIDLYKDLHTARLLHTAGELTVENGAPIVQVRLDTSALTTGKYVLGISGDPFFAYCTVSVS